MNTIVYYLAADLSVVGIEIVPEIDNGMQDATYGMLVSINFREPSIEDELNYKEVVEEVVNEWL